MFCNAIFQQEWELREFVDSEIRKVSKEFTGSKNVVYPFLVFKTLAMRRAGFFVWNIILIMVRERERERERESVSQSVTYHLKITNMDSFQEFT